MLPILQSPMSQIVDTVSQVASSVGTAVPEIKKTSILSLVFDPNSLWIMIPLMLMLIFGIYIFVERWLTLRQASREEQNFMNNIRDFVHDGKIESAKVLCKGNGTPLARMIEKGLSRVGKPLNDISAAVENAGQLEIQQLEKRVSVLATIASIAPMLGFLGTVVGMIIAFHNMASNPNNLSITILSSGIYTAMITTVGGLIVNIIVSVFYNILVAKISHIVYVLEDKATEFMDLLHEPI
ncbi:MAG TPA: MotA/TolQ/ExbB proton channel family protein [Bacteroidales bacterium]|nr:MotA/TolQ/ExbB proton channel family protein [Bacteroidales bacterium]